MRLHTPNHFSNTCLSFIVMVAMTVVTPMTVSYAKNTTLFSKRNFSNVIFFGDSLTDFGNGPDSLTFDGEPLDGEYFTSISGIFNNIYVPMSNPVNRRHDRILPGTHLRFPPTKVGTRLFRLTLPPQLPLCSNQGCVEKTHRSLNWTEYFVYNGVLEGVLAGMADLRPWIIQFNDTPLSEVSIRQSVNYAFYSALSGEGCANVNLFPLSCTFDGKSLQESIFTRQNEYRTNQSETDAEANAVLRSTIIIPAFHTQIDLFEADRDLRQVEINDHTLVIVYTGANDLGAAFFQLENGIITPEEFFVEIAVTIPGKIAEGIERLMSLGAKNILVLGQFNLGLTPRVLADVEGPEARHEVASEIGALVKIFNGSLKERIENFESKRIVFVDIQTPIQNAADTLFIGGQAGYYFSIGEQCVDATAGIIQQGKAASCFSKDVPLPIGFWNLSHLATQYNQLIAAAVLENLTPSQRPKHKRFGFLK
ncbi:MAG: SGNH/GDSL hydrolase family protein [Nitrospirales bacterium]|nr:SGNH/GDSL hydrolase family protein [Nitrospirales bacterium]